MFGDIEWLYRAGWQPRGGRGINQGAWQAALDWWTLCRSEAE